MADAPALSPCPFCGEQNAEVEADRLQGTKWGRVVCRSCGACGSEVRTGYDTRSDASWHVEAIAEWNRRAPSAAEVRARALEEAAKIADQYSRPSSLWNYGTTPGRIDKAQWEQGRLIAEEIRALAQEPKP